MFKCLFQLDFFFIQIPDFSIHADSGESFLPDPFQDLLVFALSLTNHRTHDGQTGPLPFIHQMIHDLIHALTGNLTATNRTMRYADSGVHQTQIIMDLRYRTNGGTRILRCGLLVNGNRRRQTFDMFHIRFIHLTQELSCVGRQALHISSLPLCIDRIKGQGRLSGTGQPRQNHHLIAGNHNIDILQIVFLCTFYNDVFR